MLVYLGPLIQHKDPKLKRQILACLSHIAFHNQTLTEQVIHNLNLEELLKNLKDPDDGVKLNAAECIKNFVKHEKLETAKYICSKETARALVEYIKNNRGTAREPALWAIFYIAKVDEGLATTIVGSDAVPTILEVLNNETDENIVKIAASALGALGRHRESQAVKELADRGVMNKLLDIIIKQQKKVENRSADLIKCCKDAIKQIIENCLGVVPLNELILPDIKETPKEILILVLTQLVKALSDKQAQKKFAEIRGLEKLLRYKSENSNREDGDKNVERMILEVIRPYPDELINYFTPNYPIIRFDQVEGGAGRNPDS